MRYGSPIFRMSIWLATTSLSLATTLPALAQPAPPAGAEDAADAQAADPPALAGGLAEINGTVSTHGQGQADWTAAGLNTPVTTGDAFWTEPGASAGIEVGGDRVAMSEATELDIDQLDQTSFNATLPQGEIYLNLPYLPEGQTLALSTPRGSVQISATGQYAIQAGDSANPTQVTVLSGAAQVTGDGVNLNVGPQQTATLSGGDHIDAATAPAQPDDFVRAQLDRDRPPPPDSIVPQQVRYMTGGGALARYGNWQSTTDYGAVWYPKDVPADWAPYRNGHWSYVAPWGWTWVDNAPWGFAPFHYGRWVSYGGRWGWVAAAPDAPVSVYPVYAPALVSFVNVSGALLTGAAIGFGAGVLAGGGGVGWVPLGFREPYYPWYHTSPRYLQNINRVSVVNVTNITINNYRNVTVNNFRNAGAATIVPANAMVRGQAMRGFARPLPAALLARATPVVGRIPVRPAAATPGLTPAAARRYNIALPARPAGHVIPGPVIRPAPAGRPGALPPRPPLRPAPVAGTAGIRPGLAPRPGQPPRPGAPGPAIGGQRPGLPPLRPAPGARPETNRPDGTPPEGLAPNRPGFSRPDAVRPQPIAPQARPQPTVQPVRPQPAGPGRPNTPATRPTPPTQPGRPDSPPVNRPATPPPARPQTRPAPRPDAQRPGARPAPALPTPTRPETRPQPRPDRPAPAARPENRPAPAPRPENRPAPPPAARPAPRPEARPAPQPRPAPKPAPGKPDDKNHPN